MRSILGVRFPPHIERVDDGVSTWVYRVVRSGETYYLRVLPEEESTFAPEVRVHQAIRGIGVRAPEVLHYEAVHPLVGRSTVLTTEIPGQPLHHCTSPDIVRAVLREAGRDLARTNSIPVAGWGWISRDMAAIPNHLRADDASLNTLIERDYASYLEEFLSSDQLRTVQHRLSHASDSQLAHGDLDITHVYFNDGQYTGIIDFGEIRGMPAIYDLAHYKLHEMEQLPYPTLPWLIDGWTGITPLPDDYQQQISIWSLLNAARTLARARSRDPDSSLVTTALIAIERELATL